MPPIPQQPKQEKPVKVPPGAGTPEPMPTPDGVEVAYFAFKVGGPDGRPVGLFRIADDQAAQALVMERFTPGGEWEDDPNLIDDLHEPGAYSVDEQEAQAIQQEIVQGASGQ